MSNHELPWFPWYPDAFDASTKGWPFMARAIYRALLDFQWQSSECRIFADLELLSRAIGVDRRTLQKWWPLVGAKFPQGRNHRLEEHRLAAIELHQRRVEAGRKGGRSLEQSLSHAEAMLEHCSSIAQAMPPTVTDTEERSINAPVSVTSPLRKKGSRKAKDGATPPPSAARRAPATRQEPDPDPEPAREYSHPNHKPDPDSLTARMSDTQAQRTRDTLARQNAQAFEEQFRRRFGVTPDEAHKIRATADGAADAVPPQAATPKATNPVPTPPETDEDDIPF